MRPQSNERTQDFPNDFSCQLRLSLTMENLMSYRGVCVWVGVFFCLVDYDETDTCLENIGLSENFTET